MTSFYISTPIYYVNDVPHLGHAYTTIVADTLARFHRSIDRDHPSNTFLLTGTDEHGQKIAQAAAKRNKQPIELANEVVTRFQNTWQNLGIAHDDFIRTTEERHKRVVADLWRRIANTGDIYLDSYEGWYCVACEAYYSENQLVSEQQCPIHKTKASWVSEPSYFFRMSAYQDALLHHIDANPQFIQPTSYRNEIVAFVRRGLRDLSVSRTSFRWGVPVPDDPKHVIYVWIDALANYISALGGIDAPMYQKHWPATCHLIGKDILRFHAVYWPCMLLAAKLPLPKTILAHGWWTVRGEKISKSLPATRVDPNQLANDLGADALRYFLLREVPLGLDGDFSYASLINRYNADLANDLGNLLHRCLNMAKKFCDGKVPSMHTDLRDQPIHKTIMDTVLQQSKTARKYFETYQPSRALEEIWHLVKETNRYVDVIKPWSLAKDPHRTTELHHCVRTFLEAIYAIAQLVWPAMPQKSQNILCQLGIDPKHADRSVPRWPSDDIFFELPTGLSLLPGEALFPRIDEKHKQNLLEQWVPKVS